MTAKSKRVTAKRLLAPLALAASVLGVAPELAAGSVSRTLASSRQLWATIDVCRAATRASTIGIRGSMPSDGHPKDVMYMRFRVQYLDQTSRTWVAVAHGGDSGLVRVGRADAVRQAGVSFQFAPTAGNASFTLRGLVVFQWRRKGGVVATQTRTTSAGHRSLVGSDPPGFSAATCKLP